MGENAERQHFNTAWTFNLIFSSLTALFLPILTLPAAHFYHAPYSGLIISVAVLIPFHFFIPISGIAYPAYFSAFVRPVIAVLAITGHWLELRFSQTGRLVACRS